MSLLPSSPDVTPDTNPRVVGVDSEDADRLMSALSSATARCMLSELHDDPAPPAELAARVDTSLQNTQYHLANLEEAGAVEVVGTAYSEKGREMDVYAPADKPLVIFAGRDQEASGLRAALQRLVGAVAALLVGSVAVQEVFGEGLGQLLPFGMTADSGGAGPAGDGGGGGAAGTPTATPTGADGGRDGGDAGGLAAGGDGGGDGGGAGTPTGEATASPAPSDGGGATPTPDGPTAFDATPQPTGSPTETAAEQAGDAATHTETVVDTVTATPTPTPEAAQHGADAVLSLPPGALFFLGGLTVLAVAVVLDARR